ncbi:MAG TPA: FAD-dependent monooxygenase [Niabella sp.]|nr:FAD-dependent monooxygenase [Niabella sp.]
MAPKRLWHNFLIIKMNNPTVLISGAGPSGLMMAAQLAMFQVPFRIIDKNEDHTTQSRALVIHARSLEIFDQMGIANEAIKQGEKARAVNLIANGKRKLRFNLEGVGCMVDSCRECKYCKDGLEQYCAKENIQTYIGANKHLGKQTFGGYSERIIADEDFVLHVPENLDIPRNPGNS